MNPVAATLKWVYIALCLAALSAVLYFFDGKPNSDAGTLLIYAMLVLSFPISFVFAAVETGGLWLISEITGRDVPTTYLFLVVTWLGFFAVGYVQWFVLVPKLLEKLRARRSADHHASRV